MVKHWQELIILIFALIFGAIVSSFFFHFVSVYIESTDTVLYLINAITTQVFMFLGAVVLFFKITKINFQNYINFNWVITKKEGLQIALFFGIAVCATIAVSPISNFIESNYSEHPWVEYQQTVTELQNSIIGNLRGLKIIIALAVFALLPAFAEEIVFRGILYRIFKDLLNRKRLAMFLSALIFSIFHFQVLSFIPILIIGYLLAVLYERTNNLTAPIILHFAFNALQIIFWQA